MYMKDDKLPDKWCIKVTEENIDTLSDWRVSQRYPCGDRITKVHGYISNTGISERLDKYTGAWFLSVPLSHTEITFEQFKKYVLKQDDMKEKKIIGYKPKDINCFEYAKNFAKKYTAYGYDEGYSNVRIIAPSCGHCQFFKEAGVLDLWFEPVYEEEKKLPKICGYEGLYKKNDRTVKYGCKTVPVEEIMQLKEAIDSLNEGVESITLSTGESITKEQIDQIVEYTQHV